MLRENLRIFKKLMFAADLSLVALGFQLSVIVENAIFGLRDGIFAMDELLLPAVLIWGLVFWYEPECYVFRLKRIRDVVKSSLKASLTASGLFLAFIFFSGYLAENRLQIMLFSVLSAMLTLLFRLLIVFLLHYCRKRGFNYQTVLIIGTGKLGREFADKILTNLHFGLKIIGFLDWGNRRELWRYRDIPRIGHVNDLPRILQNSQVDFVVFAVGHKYLGAIEGSLKICEEMGVRVSLLADFFRTRIARRKIESFFGAPMICYDPAPGLNFEMVMKNITDRILAVVGIIIAAPIMMAATVAIKLTSPGPVVFKQPRCGLNGRIFTLYKFRTMVQNAEEQKKDLMRFNEVRGAAFKMKNDPRITTVGKFLRKTSIDELPQLFNILKGEMSLVGPRPPLANEVSRYDRWQRRKLSMKPGLTCLWQISGRSDVSFEEWMKLDLQYIDNWSFWKDAEILARTVPAIIKGTGAR